MTTRDETIEECQSVIRTYFWPLYDLGREAKLARASLLEILDALKFPSSDPARGSEVDSYIDTMAIKLIEDEIEKWRRSTAIGEPTKIISVLENLARQIRAAASDPMPEVLRPTCAEFLSAYDPARGVSEAQIELAADAYLIRLNSGPASHKDCIRAALSAAAKQKDT